MTNAQGSEFNRRSMGTAGACVTAIMFGPGPLIVAGMGLLLTAVSEEFGWSRTTFSTIPLLTAGAAALTAPLFGRWLDRVGARKVLIGSKVAFGIAFLGLVMVPSVTWMFFAAYILVGLMAGSQGPVGYNKILCQWFVQRRGMMIALIAALGSGLGYALVPQIVNFIIVNYSWRAAYLAISCGILFVAVPILFVFLRERKRADDVAGTDQPDSAAGEEPPAEGLTQAEGLRSLEFWKLAAVLFLGASVYYGVLLHLFPMLIDRGVDRTLATSTISVVAIGAVVGQLSAAFLLDRMSTPRIALFYFAAGLIGILLLHHTVNAQLLIAAAVLIGIGQGAELSVIGYMTSRVLGLRAFGGLFGLIYAGANAASGAGPLLMGVLYDANGSYDFALYLFEGMLVLALLLILLISPYRYGRAKT